MVILAAPVFGSPVSARWHIIERRAGVEIRHEGEPLIAVDGEIPYEALRYRAMEYCGRAFMLHGEDWPALQFGPDDV